MRRSLSKKTVFRALIIVIIASAASCVKLDTPVANIQGADNDNDTVVVLHGFGRSKSAMWQLANRLEDTGYRVARVGYRSLQDTPEQILEDLGKQIDACCIGRSQKLHFVGHSLGGLLIRAYLMNHDIANLGRVVLIGTPNTGMEIVDNLRHEWWFVVLGPTAQVLGTDGDSFPKSIGPPDYPVGVIAGISTIMPNEDWLPGDDDGLVSVESTKIEGMEDFVVVERRHSALRYDKDVAHYVVSFLKTGRFNKSGE